MELRFLDIHEDRRLGEEVVASWIRQASDVPGWVPYRRPRQRGAGPDPGLAPFRGQSRKGDCPSEVCPKTLSTFRPDRLDDTARP